LKLSQSDPAKAIDTLRLLIKSDPANVKARSLMAQLEGRVSKTNWSEGRKEVNADARKLYSEGIWHYNNGRIQKAKIAFEKALASEPGFDKAKIALDKCKAYLM
jgi:tetratricopeptide (TPR) repeat protein